MKLKTVEIDGKQYAEINEEGRVLYDNDGKEFAFDAADTYSKIQQLTGEAKTNREAKQALESQLVEMTGKLEGVDLSKMVDAGKIDEVKAQLAESYQAKIDEINQKYENLKNEYTGAKISSAFSDSAFIAEKLNLPPEVARATFAGNVKTEDGKIVLHDNDGQPIYSRQNPGSLADFDEGLGILVESLPYRDRILKPLNHQGSGGDNQGGQARTISRAEFEKMSASEQSEAAAGMRSGSIDLIE